LSIIKSDCRLVGWLVRVCVREVMAHAGMWHVCWHAIVLLSCTEAERKNLGVLELRQKAAQFALSQVDGQREQFKRWVGGLSDGTFDDCRLQHLHVSTRTGQKLLFHQR
jgi:hypothetical protein